MQHSHNKSSRATSPGIRHSWHALRAGFRDGTEIFEHGQLGVGMTYEHDKLNEIYDMGVNLGIAWGRSMTLETAGFTATISWIVMLVVSLVAIDQRSTGLVIVALVASMLAAPCTWGAVWAIEYRRFKNGMR